MTRCRLFDNCCERVGIMTVILVILLVTTCSLTAQPVFAKDDHYLNAFLVKVNKRSSIHDVARDHDFAITDQLEDLGYHLLERRTGVAHRSKRRAVHHIKRLQDDSRVEFVEQQKVLVRVKREIVHDKQLELPSRNFDPSEYYRAPQSHLFSRGFDSRSSPMFNDPFFKDMWYCDNRGQSGGTKYVDLNIIKVWKQGYTGRGVTITVLDDGIDHSHKDLKNNYDPFASADFNDKNDKMNDPMPNTDDLSNSHGTRCAGEIVAEANNNVCSVGIAYNAKIGGIRILDGDVYDHLEAKALNFKNNYVDVMSASWGPRDDGITLEAPGRATLEALKQGVLNGRNGKGMIYVWATGNGGVHDDDCGADGYVSSPYTLSVGSVSDRGQAPYFEESCASTMCVVPSGGEVQAGEFNNLKRPKIKVITTDLNGGCTLGFEGTSAAAPLAAGVIALVLEANPNVTWRDIQYIVVKTAKIPSVDKNWIVNGAGRHVSHTYGFGVLDAAAMVNAALNWKSVPKQIITESPMYEVNKPIPSRYCVQETIKFGADSAITQLEHVQLYIKLEHSRRGDLQIYLVSPHNTVSTMLSKRSRDKSKEGINYTFMTVHKWGENPWGRWTVKVCDNRESTSRNTGIFEKFQVIWYGVASITVDHRISDREAYKPSLADVNKIKKKELFNSRQLQVKRNKMEKKKKKSWDENDNFDKKSTDNDLMDEIYDIMSKRDFRKNNAAVDNRGFNKGQGKYRENSDDRKIYQRILNKLDDLTEKQKTEKRSEAELLQDKRSEDEELYEALTRVLNNEELGVE